MEKELYKFVNVRDIRDKEIEDDKAYTCLDDTMTACVKKGKSIKSQKSFGFTNYSVFIPINIPDDNKIDKLADSKEASTSWCEGYSYAEGMKDLLKKLLK